MRVLEHPGSNTMDGSGDCTFSILISHTLLAATVVPLVAITLLFALRRRFSSHRKLARWTFPVWMYVSVTGVLVYILLYQL